MSVIMIDLLRRAFHRCNRAGTTIGVLVAVVGAGLVALQLFAPGYALRQMQPALPVLLGREEAVWFGQELSQARVGTNDALMLAGETALAVQAAADRLPLEKQDAMFEEAGASLGGFLRVALIVAGAVLVLEVVARVVALAAVTAPERGGVLRRAIAATPRLIGVWIALAAVTGLWLALLILAAGFLFPGLLTPLAILSLALPLLLYPRFALAPAIVLAENAGVAKAVRLSYRRTKNRYSFALLALVTMQVAVLLTDRMGNVVVGTVVSVASARSPYAPVIGLALTFAHVVFVAYRAGFVVELNERMAAIRKQQ